MKKATKIIVLTLTLLLLITLGTLIASAEDSVTVRIMPNVSQLPTVSVLQYGEPLYEAEFTGGIVTDPITGVAVDGEWKFKEPYHVLTDGESAAIIFYPDNPKRYYQTSRMITVRVMETTPVFFKDSEIASDDLTTMRAPISLGKIISNPVNGELDDFGEYELYYVIDGDDVKHEIEGDELIITDKMRGKTVTVYVKYDGIEGKYEATEGHVSLEVNTHLQDFFWESTYFIVGMLVFAIMFTPVPALAIVITSVLMTPVFALVIFITTAFVCAIMTGIFIFFIMLIRKPKRGCHIWQDRKSPRINKNQLIYEFKPVNETVIC